MSRLPSRIGLLAAATLIAPLLGCRPPWPVRDLPRPAKSCPSKEVGLAKTCPRPDPQSEVIVLVEEQDFSLVLHFVAYDDGTVYFRKGKAWWVVQLDRDELETLVAELDAETLVRARGIECNHLRDNSDPVIYLRHGRRWIGRTIPTGVCRATVGEAFYERVASRVLQFDHERAVLWGDSPY